MLVSVIVPCYKKEKTIKKDLENIFNVLSSTRYKFEIIVVVDGFLDKTFERASEFSKKNVKVVGYKENRGKGYAVRYGMARAKGDVIAFIDSGMEINANGISMVLEHLQWYNAHIVVGSKRHSASKVNYPFVRRVYSFFYQLLVYVLFWLKVKDTQTGLKVFRREVLEDVLPRLVVKKYAFDVEVLAVAYYLGYTRIFEAPVEVNFDASDSAISYFLLFDSHVRGMIMDTLAIYYRMHILNYYHDSSKHKWVTSPELIIKIEGSK